MVGNTPDFSRDCIWRQNNVHKSGANCAARHGVELCALFSLREGQPASCFDRAQTSSAIAPGSGKHDADSARSAIFSERFKKMVDGDVESLCAADQCQLPILGDDAFVRWLHINGIWLWRDCSCKLGYWH